MKFAETAIPGVFVVEPSVFWDQRGFFYEWYRKDLFAAQGIGTEFVQDNHSCSSRATLRGLHFQAAPFAQAKLVRVTRGEAFDVVVDVRKDSPTFGKHVTETLNPENKKMLYVPAGFAHGFLALKEDTEFEYKVSAPYSPTHERGIAWNDASLGIRWPQLDEPYRVSAKDSQNAALSSL